MIRLPLLAIPGSATTTQDAVYLKTQEAPTPAVDFLAYLEIWKGEPRGTFQVNIFEIVQILA